MNSYKITNIDWDTDKLDIDLPTEKIITIEESVEDIYQELADRLSDETAYCVNSFSFEEIPHWSELVTLIKKLPLL